MRKIPQRDSDSWQHSGRVTPTPPPVAMTTEPVVAPSSIPASSTWSLNWTLTAGLLVLGALFLVRSISEGPVAHGLRTQALAADAVVRTFTNVEHLERQKRCDEQVDRAGYTSIRGGVFFVPKTFSSRDGSYDLLVHFHGNVKVVLESLERSKLNAVLAVINLGTGSAPYQDAYAVPGAYETLLSDVQSALRTRGLASPRLRRVALSSWSAGYGAIGSVLTWREGRDPLDALLVLDGIHVGWMPGGETELMKQKMTAFIEAAHVAASGEMLFTITCSQIDPPGYAGSRRTANFLLGVGEEHGDLIAEELQTPRVLKLKSMVGAVAKEDERALIPVRDVHVGLLHVREYEGQRRGDHMAHLFQMGATVLPELVERWSNYEGYSGRLNAIRVPLGVPQP